MNQIEDVLGIVATETIYQLMVEGALVIVDTGII